MHPLRSSSGRSRRVLLSMLLALLPAVWAPSAAAQQAPSSGGVFSFAVYGDSRPAAADCSLRRVEDLTSSFQT